MTPSKWRIALFVLSAGLFFLAGCAARPDYATPAKNTVNTSDLQFIRASDASFRFEGRFDFSNRASPAVVWEGSRISFGFEGTELHLRFGPSVEQNVFNLTLDGRTEMFAVPPGTNWTYHWPQALTSGRHEFVLFKRSEAATGQAHFDGAEVARGARTWVPVAPGYKLRMEFFGDSIMVGACNEDGAADQWEDRRTHNNALSYTAMTAVALAGDYRCHAISGMGIAAGYVEIKAGQAWNKLYPRADSPLADLRGWQPEVAFVNFGENDDSFTRNQKQPFPSGFTTGYVDLIKAIRAAYPHTHIVLLRGGMFGGSQSQELRLAWEGAVKELESIDGAISHFVFTHWSSNHPRVSDDRALADELTTWLKQQPFMARFL